MFKPLLLEQPHFAAKASTVRLFTLLFQLLTLFFLQNSPTFPQVWPWVEENWRGCGYKVSMRQNTGPLKLWLPSKPSKGCANWIRSWGRSTELTEEGHASALPPARAFCPWGDSGRESPGMPRQIKVSAHLMVFPLKNLKQQRS